MAKRKHQNMELERQLKQRRMIFRVISLLVSVAIVFAVGFGIWATQDSRWILRYDGGRISVNDFRAVNDLMWDREMAIEHLQQVVAIRDRAIYHDVDFTDEEREMAEEQVNWEIRTQNIMSMGFDTIPFITDERLAELFAIWPLELRLADIYLPVDSITIDEDEFAILLEEYLEDELYRYLDLQVQMVMLFEREEIEEAYELIGTMPFEDIVRQFNPLNDEDGDENDDDEEPEVPSTSMIDIIDLFEEYDKEYLLGLQAGEYTRIIELDDGGMMIYLIFHAVSREEPDPDVATESFRESQIQQRRAELFDDLIAEWVEESNFRVNRRGYNSVA